MLQQARKLQAGDAAAALSTLERHALEYPEGTFREEREALAIELLARLGLGERARERASAFLNQYPRSAYRARLAQVLDLPM